MSMGYIDLELDLLSEEPVPGEEAASANSHAMRTAPIFTGDVLDERTHNYFPQRALYGRVTSQHTVSGSQSDKLVSPKLYINSNAPFSALVCGVQGSGKSHSTSVLLESCLINDGRIGTLPAPLSALVFHFDTAAGGGTVQPCEAAYLATTDPNRGVGASPPPVVVLVVPTYLRAMRRVYAGLPVRVEPLLFSPDDISGERLLAMMKVDENTQMPLYMESIMAILRGMEDNFCYSDFREQIGRAKFNGSQKAMLNLRLSLLDSCLNGGDAFNSIKNHFRAGQLTIIDLSSPFMDGASACGFFDIILGFFVEADTDAGGKMVVLDEAHKYLSESQSGTSGRLTDSLLTVIRQQRHLATRVIISTQEPTVVPSKFLDLCSIIIAHRFSSPKWLKVLAQHVSAADSSMKELFNKIVSLQTGQAIMFAPNGLCVCSRTATVSASVWNAETEAEQPHHNAASVGVLGQGYLIVRSRLRLTLDGGHSLLAVSAPGMSSRLGRVSGRTNETPEANQAAATEGSETAQFRSVIPANATDFPTPTPSPDVMPVSQASTSIPLQPPYTPLSPASFVTNIAAGSYTSLTPPPSNAPTFESPAQTDSAPVRSQDTVHAQQAISRSSSVRTPGESSEARSINLNDSAYLHFAPLVLWFQVKCRSTPEWQIKTIVRRLQQEQPAMYGDDEQYLRETVAGALRLGLFTQINASLVKCVDGTRYYFGRAPNVSATPLPIPISTHVVDMTSGLYNDYMPLVVFIEAIGRLSPYVNIKTITRYFQEEIKAYGGGQQDIEAAITRAVQVGLLTQVSAKSVRCVDGMVYDFTNSRPPQ